jgi:hypothetical protein
MKVEVIKRGCVAGVKEVVRAVNVNPVKIITPGFVPDLYGKKISKVSKQVGQMSLCKVEESDRVKLAVARIKAVSRLFLLALAFGLRL